MGLGVGAVGIFAGGSFIGLGGRIEDPYIITGTGGNPELVLSSSLQIGE